jgi:ATP-dependent 26S proteasome regulatory subunit
VDPSILRPGRFGVHIPVPLPDEADRRAILRLHLGGKMIEDTPALDHIAETLAKRTEGFSGARLRQVSEEAKRSAVRGTGYARAVAPTLEQALQALELESKET